MFKRQSIKKTSKVKKPSMAQIKADMAALARSRTVSAKRATVARRVVPGILRSSSAEIKAIDIASASYNFLTIAAPPVMTLLNGVQVGAAFYNRIGSKMEMKSLHIRGSLQNAATDADCFLRMIVFYDRQPNAAAPVITDLIQSRDQTGAAATTAVSEINLDNRDRFVIIRDKQWFAPAVTNTAGVLTNGPQYPGDDERWDVNEFIKLNQLVTHFKSSTNPTVIGDINTGALFITFLTNGTTATWIAKVGFRLRFGDM